MLKRVIKWVIFSVLLAMLPLFTNWLFHFITDNPITFKKLISHGELLLIAAALVGTALGEVISSDDRREILLLCGGGGCVLIVIMASMLFAYVSGAILSNGTVNISVIKTISITMYICAFLTSGFCIMCIGD